MNTTLRECKPVKVEVRFCTAVVPVFNMATADTHTTSTPHHSDSFVASCVRRSVWLRKFSSFMLVMWYKRRWSRYTWLTTLGFCCCCSEYVFLKETRTSISNKDIHNKNEHNKQGHTQHTRTCATHMNIQNIDMYKQATPSNDSKSDKSKHTHTHTQKEEEEEEEKRWI